MPFLNIAGYKFVELTDLTGLQQALTDQGSLCELKGTILLSLEGINLSLAGSKESVANFLGFLKTDPRFADLTFRESFSEKIPFKRFKVRIKKEIITMGCAEIQPAQTRAPAISPQQFKQWLDEKKEMVVLDTRNEYEIQVGAFKGATHLSLNDFNEFPNSSDVLSKEKTIVMMCTGGIRCEKAALYLMQKGATEVYQLEGGILNYFKEVGGAHYEGECFVFDDRVALDTNLKETTKYCLSDFQNK